MTMSVKQYRITFTAPSFPKPARKTAVHIVQSPEGWKKQNRRSLDSGAWQIVSMVQIADAVEALPPVGIRI